jgi:acetyl esterase/lipase
MDVYYPPLSTPMPAPVVMFIHGGGWQGGDKTSSIGMVDVPRLTKRGYVVVSINYRMYPFVFPAYVEDAKCAVRHLRANAGFYRIDPARVGVWGHSAGGHIAAMLGVTSSGVYEGNGGYAGFSSQVDAVATYAGAFDVTALQDFPTMSSEFDRLFGNNKAAASPITYVTPGDVPFLIFHGTMDKSIHIRQAQNTYNRLGAAGVSAQMLTVVNGSHTLVSSYGTTASPDRHAISDSLAVFFNKWVK